MTVSEIRKHPNYANAKCPVKKLCDFVVTEQHHDAQIERCTFCGKRIIYNKINGSVDQIQYGRDHVRDFLQPGAAAYEEIYGTSWRNRKPYEKKQPTQQEVYDEAFDTAKTLERLEGKGYRLDKDKIF